MPAISRFYGIVIKMYFLESEHNPPHIHAIYGDDAATFEILSGNVLDGQIPARATSLVREWINRHKEELLEIWTTQEFRRIDPIE